MTDNEIIKALESEIHLTEYVDSDYCNNIDLSLIKSTLDLIKQLQAEIERLKGECVNCPMLKAKSRTIDCLNEQIKDWQKGYCELKQEIKTIKAETIKEFAEKLKDEASTVGVDEMYDGQPMYVSVETIDNLVKEMVSE